jgi:protein-disulfide isomerase-like protein with CxxC motif
MNYVVTYIGLPDRKYRDVFVEANSYIEARDNADYELLQEYGKDGFDCLSVEQYNILNN